MSLSPVASYRLVKDRMRVAAFCSSLMDNCDFGAFTAIGLEKNGELVGGVVYDGYYGTSISAHIAGVGQGWLTRSFLRAMFQYPFAQLGVNRMTGPVASTNEGAIRLVRHLGFEQEAYLKGAVPGGDLLFFVMWKCDCRFLGEKYGTV